jgi:hypothetical protein
MADYSRFLTKQLQEELEMAEAALNREKNRVDSIKKELRKREPTEEKLLGKLGSPPPSQSH